MNEMLQKIRAALAAGPHDQEDLLVLLQEVETTMAAEVAAREELEATAVRRLVGAVSYTEADALRAIVKEVPDEGGLFNSSKLADRTGITRSVVTSAVRKAESAGVIVCRSLGMKGTHVKPLCRNWRQHLTASLAGVSRPGVMFA